MASAPATAGGGEPSARGRSLGLRLLLVLGGLVGGLLLAELGAALLADDARPYLVDVRPDDEVQLLRYEPDSPLRWVPNPAHPEFNAQGVRGEDFAAAPAEGRLRIVVVGDSVPFGLEVPREASYPEVLEQELRAAGVAVEVINAGVPAYTGQQVGELFHQRVLGWAPGLVLISVTSNDLDPLPVVERADGELRWVFYEDRHGPEMQRLLDGLPETWHLALWRRSHLYRRLARARLAWREGPAAGADLSRSEQRNIAALAGIYQTCRARGIPAAAVLVPVLVDRPDPMWAPRLARLADGLAAAGCPLVDLRETLATPAQPLSTLRVAPEDPWHLNAAGHRRVAVLVLARLRELGLVAGLSPAPPVPSAPEPAATPAAPPAGPPVAATTPATGAP